MFQRTWHLHGCLDGCPEVMFQGPPQAHAAAQRAAKAMAGARRAFRFARNVGDFGGMIEAELAWRAGEAALRPVLAIVSRADRALFTPEQIDAAVDTVRRCVDRSIDYRPEPAELYEDDPDEDEYDDEAARELDEHARGA